MRAPGAGLRRAPGVDVARGERGHLVGAGDVQLTPDGAHVFYSRSELDWGENERKRKLPAEPDTAILPGDVIEAPERFF